MLEKLKKYDTINQYEAAMLLADTIDTKSKQFKNALLQIDRAIDAGVLPSTQAIDLAKARGKKDRALGLQIRKMFIPVQLKEDEKQTIINMKDYTVWTKVESDKTFDVREKATQQLMLAVLVEKNSKDERNRVSMVKRELENAGVKRDSKTIKRHLDACFETLKEAV